MADVKRFSNKTEIELGTESTNFSLKDILPTQHTTGDNNDYKATLGAIKTMIVGTCTTAASTATKAVTLINYPADVDLFVGMTVLVKFTLGNSASTQVYLSVGNADSKPATARGFAITEAFPAGSEFVFVYDGTNWNTQDFAITSLNTSSKMPVDSTAVNGALANQLGTYKIGTCERSDYFSLTTEVGLMDYNAHTFRLFITDLSTGNCVTINGTFKRNTYLKYSTSSGGMSVTSSNQYGTLVISGLSTTVSNNQYQIFYK